MNARVIPEENKHLVEENLLIVPYILNRCYGYTFAKDEDNLSKGNFALCKAAATYDPNKGVKFDTYAARCIIQEFANEFRTANRQKRSNGMSVASLNFQVPSDYEDGDAEELIDLIPDTRENTEKAATDRIMYDRFRKYMPTYVEMLESGLNESEFARQRGITRQRINAKIRDEKINLRRRLIATGEYAAMGGE